MKQYKLALLITAGGSSQRYGKNKLLEKINSKELILHTLDAFKNIPVAETVITVSDELREKLTPIINTNAKLINGGKTRQESVFNGLKALSSDTDLVIIHDGARPLIKEETILKCISKAKETNASIVAVKAIDTIKAVNKQGEVTSTPNRNNLYYVQTPQIFDFKMILDAHKKFEGQNFSDDSLLIENIGGKVHITEGDYSNIKITTQSDLQIIKNYLEN